MLGADAALETKNNDNQLKGQRRQSVDFELLLRAIAGNP
jgi:hypothetical protein